MKTTLYTVLFTLLFSIPTLSADWLLTMDQISNSKDGKVFIERGQSARLFRNSKADQKTISHVEFVVFMTRGLNVLQKPFKSKKLSYNGPRLPKYAERPMQYFMQYIGTPGDTVFPAFNTYQNLTRAQAAEVLYRFIHHEHAVSISVTPMISDIDGHWAQKYIEAVVALGIMDLQQNSSGKPVFRPQENVSKHDAGLMVFRAAYIQHFNHLRSARSPKRFKPKSGDYLLKGTGFKGFAVVGAFMSESSYSNALRYDFGNGYMLHAGAQIAPSTEQQTNRNLKYWADVRIGHFGLQTFAHRRSAELGAALYAAHEVPMSDYISLGLAANILTYDPYKQVDLEAGTQWRTYLVLRL
jgi:hypothetical protein